MAKVTGATKTKVLLVEDDPVVTEIVIELLKVEHCVCTTAASCAEARERVKDNAFACALIDLGLPDGNGLRLLPDLKNALPWLVPIILTGDTRADTIVDTMRAGAFDYLTKPFNAAALRAAVARALEHHDAIRERDRLFDLLSEEREQLKVRVDEATRDLRQYAEQIETMNARLQSLLRLTQMPVNFYTDETLFRGVFEELDKHLPINCLALCGYTAQDFLAAVRGSDGDIQVILSDSVSPTSFSEAAAEASNGDLAALLVERHTDLDIERVAEYSFQQKFWGRRLCTVAFFLSPEFEVDAACDEFLGMCAHFLAVEWQEAQLLLHAVKDASMGDIAFELYKGFIQGLTAIRTAADIAAESDKPEESAEAHKIICDNVEGLQRQIREFRQLSSQRKDTVETVYLDQYIDQAIAMLSMAIQSRGVEIHKDYQTKCECVLLNGSSLARTFLDLISSALRTVEKSGEILLRLSDEDSETVMLLISCNGMNAGMFGDETALESSSRDDIRSHPKFLLAQRTVRSCGGRLTVDQKEEDRFAFRIRLPRNALASGVSPESLS
jgi:DNA-binding response OmpR family regulator